VILILKYGTLYDFFDTQWDKQKACLMSRVLLTISNMPYLNQGIHNAPSALTDYSVQL
jgi:hypothetical protein